MDNKSFPISDSKATQRANEYEPPTHDSENTMAELKTRIKEERQI